MLNRTLTYLAVFVAALVALSTVPAAADRSKPVEIGIADFVGSPVDVAPFGEFRTWEDGKDIGVMWEDSRDIFKVVVTFTGSGEIPDPSTVKLQYWKTGWPQQRVPRGSLIGSGSAGWIPAGDWYGGHWETADVHVEATSTAYPIATTRPTPGNYGSGPFNLVPTDHWVYEALRQMAADGIVVGNPKDELDGTRALTRYEFAQAIATAIPVIEAEIERCAADSASKSRFFDSDVDALRRSIQEFRDELNIMEIDVDSLRRNVASLSQIIQRQMERESGEINRMSVGPGVRVFNHRPEDAAEVTASKTITTWQARWTFTFRPINEKEFPGQNNFAATYRHTSKLRLLFSEQAPKIRSLQTFTDSVWQEGAALVEWGCNDDVEHAWDGSVEIFNGHIQGVRLLAGSRLQMVDGRSWTGNASKTNTGGVVINYLYAKPAAVNSFDETIVTVRTKRHSFSFLGKGFVADLMVPDPDYKPIYLRDFGVLIKGMRDSAGFDEAEREYQNASKNLYQQVAELPEQTLEQTWNAMPQKGRIYIPLSCEGSRLHFGVYPTGHVGMDKGWLNRIKSPALEKARWQGNRMYVRVHMPQEGAETGAFLAEGYLPIQTTWYEKDGVRYAQEAFATVLSGKLPAGGRVSADEPTVLMMKMSLTNSNQDTRKTVVPMDVWTSGAEPIVLKDGIVYSTLDEGKLPRVRISSSRSARVTVKDNQFLCEADLAPGATEDFFLAIPFLTPDVAGEIRQLKRLKYDEQRRMIASYWQKRTDEGCRIVTPEPMINDFYRANVSHQLINSESEVGNSERLMAKVGTFGYGVFTNESVMMASELDRRGYHDVAKKIYETWVHYQGTVRLPGDYTTADGVFYGANGYEQGGYNQHHGWVMWGMAEHYWFTRDKEWLNRVASNLVKAADWIISQRSRTKADDWNGIRSIEYGLLPPGSLEDIGDWRCWLANNAFSWWGLNNTAKALADIGHPEAPRLLKEAADYREDIRRAFFEAMLRTPVVSLRDGTYIPNMPSDAHRRGRSLGWITETLEGSIHMIRCGLIDPDEPAAKWIMQDYEDNRYLSKQFGYQIDDFDKNWFNLGGFSQQPSLLCSPTPYLMRDEPKHYLRAYFNAFAAGYFPERAMLTEHPLPNLGDYGGDHFKSSDEAMNTSWIRWMFIWDEGDDLHLGKMMPRYWLADGREVKIEQAATHFGPMSISMKSYAAEGSIEMTIDPPTRNRPKATYARFRHPEGKKMTRVTVNGKAWDNFDVEKEWVVLPSLTEKTLVVTYYD